MEPLDAAVDELTAIEQGRAWARPAGLRIIEVRGSDAMSWLHDLVTTDVASLAAGDARRSLLLTPTGRIRADFMVGRDHDGFMLLQRTDQPRAVDEMLSRYVLSSDVSLFDRTADLVVSTLVGATASLAEQGMSPSYLGPGRDLIGPAGGSVIPTGPDELVEVGGQSLEVWRVRRGDPRMGVDFEEGALPAEVGLEATIDVAKGCFLGQESVAKIRNMGHPPTVLRHVVTEASAAQGTPLLDDGYEAGMVTSAVAAHGSGTLAIARVAWASREAVLTSADGARFVHV